MWFHKERVKSKRFILSSDIFSLNVHPFFKLVTVGRESQFGNLLGSSLETKSCFCLNFWRIGFQIGRWDLPVEKNLVFRIGFAILFADI